MTELRFNELRGEQVVYATHRQERTLYPAPEDCPLCGRGAMTVFDNDFPALTPPDGATEVIVYTDEHEGSFGALPPEQARRLMEVWRDRYALLGARERIAYVMPFENRGEAVGVSLHHPHGQVYAFPFVPPVAAAEREADRRLGGCAICAAVAGERDAGERVVHENEHFTAYVPFAARWPYELHVTARAHVDSLLGCEPEALRDLASALQLVTRGYDALFHRPFPYMLCVHQAPTDAEGGGHLHVELYSPMRAEGKVKFLAGCEQGAGTMLMDALPEATAAELRDAIERAG